MKTSFGITLPALAAALLVGGAALARDGIETKLKGYEETPSTLSTTGKGRFSAKINDHSQTISYELSYSGLEGEVRQAHIHFGQRGLSGGISVWLCQTTNNPAPLTVTVVPICPQSGTVSGTLHAGDVIGPGGQGIAPGEFAELVAAMRAGAAYANVHTSKYPSGEIRGQLKDD